MDRGYMRGHVDRDITKGDGPIWFTAATEGVKADGIDLRMEGAQLNRFRDNPVILFGHNSWGRTNLPIGRAIDVGVEGKRLRIGIEFDQEDEFARTIERKIRAKFLNAVSIGFDVQSWEKPGMNHWNGGIATKWELLETSVVPVPMDEKATVESGRSSDLAINADLWDFLRNHISLEVRKALENAQTRIEPEGLGINKVDASRVMSSFTFGENSV
jgi:HK97 family phage prohead protease